MSVLIQVVASVFCLVLLLYVLRLVAKGRLLLKYSLLWLVLCGAMFVCALFPGILYAAADAFGFFTPSNFLFCVGFVLLLAISLSLTAIASKQTLSIKNLTQKIALLEHELEQERNQGHVSVSERE